MECVDTLDFRILKALFEDSRQSYRSLGRRVSLSHPAVMDRLKQLRGRGVLQGFFLTVDPHTLGRQDLLVRFDGEWSRDDAEKALNAPEVIWVAWKLNGNLTVQLWTVDMVQGMKSLADTLRTNPSGHFLAEPNRRFHSLSVVDWQIIDAMVDDPVSPLDQLVKTTKLSPKTVRNHLNRLLMEKTIHVTPTLGSLSDSGELVYTVSVFGQVGLPELRAALGDAYLIKQFQHPPAKHLLCLGSDLSDVLLKTRGLSKVPGATRVSLSLNKEQLVAKRTVHEMIRQEILRAKKGARNEATGATMIPA